MAESVDVQKDYNSIPILGLVPEQGTSDPPTTVEGRHLVRTDTHVEKVVLNGTVKTFATTDDTQLQSTTPRPPNGAAGGALSGSYPNPSVANNAITLAMIALALIESGVSSGTAATTDPALRKLGTGANDAMAGNRSLDTITSPAADVSFNSHKITGLLDGTSLTDGVTLQQLQNAIQGIDAKASVRVASTANVTIASPGTAIDTITLTAGDRVLLKNQSTTSQNGIYVFNGSAVPMTRALDMDSWAEVPGAFVFVEDGAVNATTGWTNGATAGGTIGSNAMIWNQFSSAGNYTGGAGLTLTGTDFSVSVDNSSLEINSDIVRVKALGIVNAMIAAGTIDLTTKVTGVLPAANGGKSAIIASPALTAGTWTDVVHSLGVKAGRVMVKVASTGEVSEVGVRDKSGSETTTIQIKVDIPAGRASSFYDVYCGI